MRDSPEPTASPANNRFRLDVVMTNATQRGGAEKLLQHLYRHSPSDLALRLVFLEDGPMVEEATALGIPTLVTRAPRFRDIAGTIRTIRTIRAWFRSGSPDLVLGWMKKAHLYSGPAAAGIAPVAWFQHENPSEALIDRVIHRIPTSGILCCSDFVRNAQSKITPRPRCLTVHPCQDVAGEGDSSIEWPVPEGRRGLVLVSRLQTWKGIHLAIEALSLLRSRGMTDLDLVVVGGKHELEPDYPARLESLIREAKLSEYVHFVGFQQNPASWMKRSDVMVHASETEPFGMVVVESIALGVVVVAARPGGPEEIVEPGEGVLWNHPDIHSLADAIVKALAIPRSAPRPDRFSVHQYVSRFDEAIRSFTVAQGDQASTGSRQE